ncbi:hypothetical protein AB0E69_15565 [Kribbella sp. NPDC026611]|uniref:hypothetical protein n=1 Tax=Kribbella sp. NPDC026611 TaxID=3154911 RepID=UPI0033D0C4C3
MAAGDPGVLAKVCHGLERFQQTGWTRAAVLRVCLGRVVLCERARGPRGEIVAGGVDGGCIGGLVTIWRVGGAVRHAVRSISVNVLVGSNW